MGPTATIERRQAQLIKEGPRPRTTSPSQWFRYAQIMAVLADRAERWEDLSSSERDLYRNAVYNWLKPGRLGFFENLRFAWLMAVLTFRREDEAVAAYVGAANRFRDAVLSGIEREHPDFSSEMEEGIRETVEAMRKGHGMTPEEFRGWLKRVSDNTFREV